MGINNDSLSNRVSDTQLTPVRALKEFFGYDGFRSGQHEIIEAILRGDNVIAILPTGGGKSLCYQIPALISPSFSIVISPLISLMKDQVDSLNKDTVRAAFINSTQEYSEIERILRTLGNSTVKLLYVAPERLEQMRFAEQMRGYSPDFVFVDEAHCISEWGHNFRPSYRKISQFIEHIGCKKIAAFTASATKEVIVDIAAQLNFKEPSVFVRGFERENISLSVIHTKKKNDTLLALLRRNKAPAIIYTASRKKTEEISAFLSGYKIYNAHYHAGLSSERRARIQEDFMNGIVDVIVATNAFGMGIDKSNVRLVVHYQTTGSLEQYYQEFGRAGRDGEPASGILLFDESDLRIHQYFIANSFPSKEFLQKLYDAVCDYGSVALQQTNAKEIPVNKDYLSSVVRADMSEGLLQSGLQILDQAGYIKLHSEFDRQSTVRVLLAPEHLKKILKGEIDALKKEILLDLLRSHGASIFERVTLVPEQLAGKLSALPEHIDSALKGLNAAGILLYDKPFSKASVSLSMPRVLSRNLVINYKLLNDHFIHAQQRLDTMVRYAYTTDCRFQFILKYFGDKRTDFRCGSCDRCQGEEQLSDDSLRYIQDHILRTLLLFEDGLAEKKVIVTLLGLTKAAPLRSSETFAALRGYTYEVVATALHAAAASKLVRKGGKRGDLLFITQKGREQLIKAGLLPVDDRTFQYEDDLLVYERLREIRARTAVTFSQPPQLICPDYVLRAAAMKKPQTKDELFGVEGFTERMYNKFGDEVLSAIHDFFHPPLQMPIVISSEQPLPHNLEETFRLTLAGKTILEIAELRGMTPAIISMQVESIIELRSELPIEGLVPQETIQRIKSVFKTGKKDLKGIKAAIGEGVTYPEIRIVLAKMKAEKKEW